MDQHNYWIWNEKINVIISTRKKKHCSTRFWNYPEKTAASLKCLIPGFMLICVQVCSLCGLVFLCLCLLEQHGLNERVAADEREDHSSTQWCNDFISCLSLQLKQHCSVYLPDATHYTVTVAQIETGHKVSNLTERCELNRTTIKNTSSNQQIHFF